MDVFYQHEQVNQQRCTTPDVLRGGICGDSGLRISHSGDSQLDRDSFSENSDSPLVRLPFASSKNLLKYLLFDFSMQFLCIFNPY